jgi:NADH:ubiquinone oxidoreductase subunit K
MNGDLVFAILIISGCFLICCKRNILFIPIGLMQLLSGIILLLFNVYGQEFKFLRISLLFLSILVAVIFYVYAMAIVLIKRRSTLRIDELTQLRG